MAKNDKLKRELKRLKKEVEEAVAGQKKAEKKLKKLQQSLCQKISKELGRKQKRKSKQTDKKTKPDKTVLPLPVKSDVSAESEEEVVKLKRISVARAQRTAWKRHSYLRDRYESYLAAGEEKERARNLANQDLVERYGTDYGYSAGELQNILS